MSTRFISIVVALLIVCLNTAFAQSPQGVITTPTPGSTLSSSSVTFGWTAGGSASAYWLTVGSTAGGDNYYSSGNLDNVLTAIVNGLPTNGSTLYLTLYSLIGGAWVPSAYTYTALNAAASGVITTPTPGSTLSGSGVTFGWTAGAGASAYWLVVGSTAGGTNYYSAELSGLTATVNGLPTNGSKVYVTLYSLIGGAWVPNAYTYTAVTAAAGGVITTPAPGSTLNSSSVAFGWTAGAGASAYWLVVGSTAGGDDYYSSGNLGNVLTATVGGLPTNGNTIYVTLYSLIGGAWVPNACTYTALSAAAGGVITTPTPGSTLSGSSVTVNWTAGAGASAYWLVVGSTAGGDDYYSSGNLGLAQTTTVFTLPANASTIYVTLYSDVGGQWLNNAYTYVSDPLQYALVAAYSFDEGTGTTVGDSSGNGNTGTIVNATWTTAGAYGDALQFNGTNSWVIINDAASLDLTTGMTLEAWVNPFRHSTGELQPHNDLPLDGCGVQGY